MFVFIIGIPGQHFPQQEPIYDSRNYQKQLSFDGGLNKADYGHHQAVPNKDHSKGRFYFSI